MGAGGLDVSRVGSGLISFKVAGAYVFGESVWVRVPLFPLCRFLPGIPRSFTGPFKNPTLRRRFHIILHLWGRFFYRWNAVRLGFTPLIRFRGDRPLILMIGLRISSTFPR